MAKIPRVLKTKYPCCGIEARFKFYGVKDKVERTCSRCRKEYEVTISHLSDVLDGCIDKIEWEETVHKME